MFLEVVHLAEFRSLAEMGVPVPPNDTEEV